MSRTSPSHYDVAQVCLNGHMVNDATQSRPQLSKRFCPDCGAETITQCRRCSQPIQGALHSTSTVGGSAYLRTPPTTRQWITRAGVRSYCHACGKPYPWTSARIDAAKALARELDELSDADKLMLQSSIDDLVTDSPRTTVAVVRFKKLGAKMGKQATDALRDILVDVMSEAAKKQIWG